MYPTYTMNCAAEERGTTSNSFRGVPSVFHYIRNHWQDNKTNNNFSKQRLQRFDFLFLTCFMLYKDVSKMRVRNIMTCFLFISQMPDSSEFPRFEFPLPLFLCNLLSIYHWIFWVIFYTKQNRVYILDYLFYIIFILSVFNWQQGK